MKREFWHFEMVLLAFENQVLAFENQVLAFVKGVLADVPIYQLNYGFEYLEFGKVIWYQDIVSMQIARAPRTVYLCGTWLKTKKYQTVLSIN